MGFFEAAFEITEEKDCPMYGCGDRFQVSGLALATSDNKPTCLFLAREVTSYMIKFLGEQRFAPKKEGRSSINCGGCTGLVKLSLRKRDEGQYATMHMRMLAASKAPPPETKDISYLSSLLNSFSLFQVMDELSLEELIPHLKVKEYAVGDLVIKKGDESSALYMVLTGSVEINDDGNVLAYLGRGEIFGEMSILTGKPVGATVKVVEPTKIIWISNEQFRLMMIKYPSIQLGITKILAQRLTTSNMLKGQSGKASFTGQISEVPVAELCQFVNNNSKTGVVTIESEGGKGVLSFSSGELVKADTGNLQGTEAFYALLKESEGNFNYNPDLPDSVKGLPPLGSFMNLLMEGLQKIDEEKEMT